MRVSARNPAHRNFVVLVDGVDISDCCVEADDIAHEAVVLVRTREGEDIRRAGDYKRLTALIRGHVSIVPNLITQRWEEAG